MPTIKIWKRKPRATVQHRDVDKWLPPLSHLTTSSDALNVLLSKMGQGGGSNMTASGEIVVDYSTVPRMLDLVGISTLEVRNLLLEAVNNAGLTPPPVSGTPLSADTAHRYRYEDGIKKLRWVEEYGSVLYIYCTAACEGGSGALLNPAVLCALGLDTIVPIRSPLSSSSCLSFGQISAPFGEVIPLLLRACGAGGSTHHSGPQSPQSSATSVGYPQSSHLPSGVQAIHAVLEVAFSSIPHPAPTNVFGNMTTFPLAHYLSSLLALDRTFTPPPPQSSSSPFYKIAKNTLCHHPVFHTKLGAGPTTYFDEAILTLLLLTASLSNPAVCMNKHVLSPAVIRTALLLHHRIQQEAVSNMRRNNKNNNNNVNTNHCHHHHPLSLIVMPPESGIEIHIQNFDHMPPSISQRGATVSGVGGGFAMTTSAKDVLLQGGDDSSTSKSMPSTLGEMSRDMEAAMQHATRLPLRTTHGVGNVSFSGVDDWFRSPANLYPPSSTTPPIYSMPTMSQLKLLATRSSFSRGVCALSLPIAAEYRTHQPHQPPSTTPSNPPALLSASKASHKALQVAVDVLTVGERLASTRPPHHGSPLNLPANFWKYNRVSCQVHLAVSKYAFGFYSSIPAGLSSQPTSTTTSSSAHHVSDVVLHDVHVYREELLAKVALRGAKQALDDLSVLFHTLSHPNMQQLGSSDDQSALVCGAGILLCVGLVHSSNYHYQREKPVVDSLIPHALPCMLLAKAIGSKIWDCVGEHGRLAVLGSVFPVEFFSDFLLPEINRLADVLLQEHHVVFQETVPRGIEQVLVNIEENLVYNPTAMLEVLCSAFRAGTLTGIIPSNLLLDTPSSAGATPRNLPPPPPPSSDAGKQLSAAVEEMISNPQPIHTTAVLDFTTTNTSAITALSDDFLDHLVTSAIQSSSSPQSDGVDSLTCMCRSVVGWMVGCKSSSGIADLDTRLKKIIEDKKVAQRLPPTPPPTNDHINNNTTYPKGAVVAEVNPRPIDVGAKRGRDNEEANSVMRPPNQAHTPNQNNMRTTPPQRSSSSGIHTVQVRDAITIDDSEDEEDGNACVAIPTKISGGLLGRMRAVKEAKTAPSRPPPTPTPSNPTPTPPPTPTPTPSATSAAPAPTTTTSATGAKVSSGLLSRIRKAGNK